MAGEERPTLTLSDLQRLGVQANRPDPLTEEEVADYAVAGLLVMRGMRKVDKRKVLRRMAKLLDS